MVEFLSERWVTAISAEPVALDDCTVEVTVGGAPGGDVKWWFQVAGARLSAQPGPRPDADAALTLPYADAVACARGELEPSVAYMQGRMKTAGNAGVVLAVVRATGSPEYRAARDAIAATTEFPRARP